MHDDDGIKYRPTLTTFFDILGFRGIVNDKEPEFILQVLEKLRKHTTPSDEYKETFDTDTIAFSDSVVRSVHLLSESNLTHPTGLLYHELFNLAWIQGCLIYEDGVFLRGAITDGDLCLRDGVVFGPALISAYELESNQAKYPRIVVDDSIIDLFERHPKLLGASHHDFDTDYEYIKALTYIDFDGRRFVDYLRSVDFDLEGVALFIDLLGQHHDCVSKEAKAVVDKPGVLEKYHWAATYHNTVVDESPGEWFEEYETNKADFVLDEGKVPGLTEWKHAPPEKR